MALPKIIVLTGAGISAESGLKTFRDSDGLWENHRIEDVATPEAFHRNPALVLNFYNERRKAARQAQPNRGHLMLAEMQEQYDVTVITQNVDDLHERAGSNHVVHLHGTLFRSRSTSDSKLTYPIEGVELNIGDCCEKGSQLRPDIVWFGEAVPMMGVACHYARLADIFMVVGTSLQVYPAASLIHDVPYSTPMFVVDPAAPELSSGHSITYFREAAGTGMDKVWNAIRKLDL